ncbi:hypothetical protein RSAG8_12633, partial [Rhizoctonia solani AG-8 WAC10335]
MAPADLLVQSAEYGRGLFTAPPRSPCTSPVNQVFDLRLKGPSGCSPHKGERAPHVLSPIKVDNKIKHSRSTKRRHELQYAGSNFLYCIVQKNVPAAGDDLQPVDTKGFASINLTVKAEPDLDDFCPLLKSLSRPNHLPITQVPKHEHGTGFAEQSDGAQDSNTNGAANGSVNNSGQHTSSGANETNELGLADLDPPSLYQLGTFLRTLALQLDSHSANAGTSRNALDSVYMSPDIPVPWHTHMNDPGSPGPTQQFSPSVNGSQPQTDVNASAVTTSAHIRSLVGRESSSYVHSDEYGHLLPDDIMLDQHFPALNSHDNSVAIPNPNVNSGVHQYVHVFRAGRLDPEPSTFTGAHRTRGPNSKICGVCGQGFRRSGYLKSHMHLHTGVKLHQCPHCPKCLAYPSGLSKHVKRCAAKVRQSKQ